MGSDLSNHIRRRCDKGAVVIFTRSKEVSLGDTEHKLARVAAGFLGRQLEQ